MRNSDEKKILILGILLSIVFFLFCIRLNLLCGILAFFLGGMLTMIFYLETRKRQKKLEELNQYLNLVCSGNYDMRLEENTEGELSILSNNLYKVILMLKTQKEQLEADKLYLAETMADITHQLKTPLTSMTVMLDLIQDEIEEEKPKEFLGVMDHQLEKMRWLVLNLLKMSKLDAGTTQLKKETVSIQEVIRESQAPFLLSLELKNMELKNYVEEFTFNGDLGWTVEAVSNIMKNCMEHMEEGGRLQLESSHNTLYDTLVIRDTGCGIAPEDMPHIFERFYRGKNASPESAGIGLALAKTILEKENAQISVKSRVGEGTTFELKFYHALV